MFSKPTVFILGAGASKHYGYPTGAELISLVLAAAERFYHEINGLAEQLSLERISLDMPKIELYFPEYIINKLDDNPNHLKQALYHTVQELEQLSKRIKQVNPLVIDYFLDHNPDLQNIGKLLISFALLDSERILREEPVTKKENWHRFIVHQMMLGCDTSDNFITNNNVSFVTFNYDTSLEKNLFESLSANTFFPDNKVIEQFLSNDRIIHVYGKLIDSAYKPNMLQSTSSSLNRFKRVKDELDPAYQASVELLTIAPSDKIKDNNSLKLASQAIEDAEEVYILGYGFDKLNNKNIGLNHHLHAEHITKKFGAEGGKKYTGKSIYFTNFGTRNIVSKRASQVFYSNPSEFLPPNGLISSDKRRKVHYEMSTKNVYDALSDDFEFID